MPYGGGGLVSSARDYDRFLAMLLGEGETDGVRIMKPATARLAMSNLLTEGVATRGSMIHGQGFGAGRRVARAGAPPRRRAHGWGSGAWTQRGGARASRPGLDGHSHNTPTHLCNVQ